MVIDKSNVSSWQTLWGTAIANKLPGNLSRLPLLLKKEPSPSIFAVELLMTGALPAFGDPRM